MTLTGSTIKEIADWLNLQLKFSFFIWRINQIVEMFIGKIAIVIVTSSCVQATFYRIFFLNTVCTHSQMLEKYESQWICYTPTYEFVNWRSRATWQDPPENRLNKQTITTINNNVRLRGDRRRSHDLWHCIESRVDSRAAFTEDRKTLMENSIMTSRSIVFIRIHNSNNLVIRRKKK